MTLERPRPILTTYPHGTRELHCHCGRVTTLIDNDQSCAFCGWSSGVRESSGRNTAAAASCIEAASTRTPELRPQDDTLADLKERKRTFVRTSRGGGLWGLPAAPADDEIVPSVGLVREAPGGVEAATETQRRTLDGRSAAKARDGALPQACTRSDCEKDRAETGECHCSVYGAPRAVGPAEVLTSISAGPIRSPVKARPPSEYAWTAQPFVVWPVPKNAERLTAADDTGHGSGNGTAWECRHGMDQIGGKRCIRCMASRGLTYVWRNPAGGSPGAWRWLCADCETVYRRLGLVGTTRTHVNAFSEATSGYGRAGEA